MLAAFGHTRRLDRSQYYVPGPWNAHSQHRLPPHRLAGDRHPGDQWHGQADRELISCGAARVLEASLRANTRRLSRGGGCAATRSARVHCMQVCMGTLNACQDGGLGCLACMPRAASAAHVAMRVAICCPVPLAGPVFGPQHHSLGRAAGSLGASSPLQVAWLAVLLFQHESAWPQQEEALQLAVSLRKWLDTQVCWPARSPLPCTHASPTEAMYGSSKSLHAEGTCV